ncbi:MAG: hypothetical protein AAGA85_27775 [Bacteroidota bacterium]
MEPTLSNCDCEEDIEILCDKSAQALTLKIGLLQAQCWSQYMVRLEEVEQYLITLDGPNVIIKCRGIDDNTTLFLMHVLKLAEQYQWLGEKEIKVNCDLGLGKGNRYWLKEKLRKYFELDIRFSGILTYGVMCMGCFFDFTQG